MSNRRLSFSPGAVRLAPGALLVLALAAPHIASASSISFEAFAGAVFGNGNNGGSGSIIGNGASGSGQSCGTSGAPTAQYNFFGIGLRTPAGGVEPCHLFGGAIDNVGASAQSANTGTVTATTNSGSSFTGDATGSASGASNGAFGLNATASASGASSIAESAGMSLIDDPNFSVSCPTCSVGEVLHPIYSWSVSFNASLDAGAPPGSFFYAALAMQQVGDSLGAYDAVFLNYTYGGGGPPGPPDQPNCYYNPTCPVFTMGPGSASGPINFSYEANSGGVTLDGTKSATWEEKAGLIVGASDAVVDPNAVLTSVAWKNSSGAVVTGVTLTTSNGIYTDSGYESFTPEPGTWMLCGFGLAATALGKLLRKS